MSNTSLRQWRKHWENKLEIEKHFWLLLLALSPQDRNSGTVAVSAQPPRAERSGVEWNGMHRQSPQTVWPLSIFFPGFVRRHLVSAGFFEFQMWHLEGSKSFIHWSDCETRRWVLKHLGSLPDRRSVITQLQGGVAAFNQVARLFFTFVFCPANFVSLKHKSTLNLWPHVLNSCDTIEILFCNCLHS